MKHAHFSLTCLPLVALLATASGAHAKQADPRTNDEKVMDAITQKLRVMVGEDPKRRGKVGSTTLILYRPGLVMSLSEEQKTNSMEVATYLNLVCNRLPAASLFFEPTGKNLEQVWEAILTNKILPSGDSILTPDQKVQLKKNEEWIDECPDPKLPDETRQERYLRFQKKYNSAYEAVQLERDRVAQIKTGARMNEDLFAELEAAQAKLEAPKFGNGLEYRKIKERVDQDSGRDPANFMSKLRTAFDVRYKTTGAKQEKLALTAVYPSFENWAKTDDWQKITLNTSQYQTSFESSTTHSYAKAGGFLGLFSGSASAGSSNTVSQSKLSGDQYDIEVEVKRVLIYRPWMNATIFTGGFWGFGFPGETSADILLKNPLAKDYLNISLGQGIGTGDVRPGELMPLLPLELLLARNLVVKAKFGEDFANSMKKEIGGRASVGWGPFSISGGAGKSETKDDSKGNMTAAGLSFAGIQVIGVYCQVMPPCPTPDPNIFGKKR